MPRPRHSSQDHRGSRHRAPHNSSPNRPRMMHGPRPLWNPPRYGGPRQPFNFSGPENEFIPCKMMISGLDRNTRIETIIDYFSRYGDVIDCEFASNPGARGVACLAFRDHQGVQYAASNGPHFIDQAAIHMEPVTPRMLAEIFNQPIGPEGNDMPLNKIFVAGLPAHNFNQNDLGKLFSTFGQVLEADVQYDPRTRRNKGFGYVIFSSEDAVNRAVSARTVHIGKCRVEIKRAPPLLSADRTDGFPGGVSSTARETIGLLAAATGLDLSLTMEGGGPRMMGPRGLLGSGPGGPGGPRFGPPGGRDHDDGFRGRGGSSTQDIPSLMSQVFGGPPGAGQGSAFDRESPLGELGGRGAGSLVFGDRGGDNPPLSSMESLNQGGRRDDGSANRRKRKSRFDDDPRGEPKGPPFIPHDGPEIPPQQPPDVMNMMQSMMSNFSDMMEKSMSQMGGNPNMSNVVPMGPSNVNIPNNPMVYMMSSMMGGEKPAPIGNTSTANAFMNLLEKNSGMRQMFVNQMANMLSSQMEGIMEKTMLAQMKSMIGGMSTGGGGKNVPAGQPPGTVPLRQQASLAPPSVGVPPPLRGGPPAGVPATGLAPPSGGAGPSAVPTVRNPIQGFAAALGVTTGKELPRPAPPVGPPPGLPLPDGKIGIPGITKNALGQAMPRLPMVGKHAGPGDVRSAWLDYYKQTEEWKKGLDLGANVQSEKANVAISSTSSTQSLSQDLYGVSTGRSSIPGATSITSQQVSSSSSSQINASSSLSVGGGGGGSISLAGSSAAPPHPSTSHQTSPAIVKAFEIATAVTSSVQQRSSPAAQDKRKPKKEKLNAPWWSQEMIELVTERDRMKDLYLSTKNSSYKASYKILKNKFKAMDKLYKKKYCEYHGFPNPPWLTQDLKKAIDERNRTFALWDETGHPQHHKTFKLARTHANHLNSQCRDSFLRNCPAMPWALIGPLPSCEDYSGVGREGGGDSDSD